MVKKKPGLGTSIADIISPEVKNILKKYQRLSQITVGMNIPEDKQTDLKWLIENLRENYQDHKSFTEAENLINKLLKIQKK